MRDMPGAGRERTQIFEGGNQDVVLWEMWNGKSGWLQILQGLRRAPGDAQTGTPAAAAQAGTAAAVVPVTSAGASRRHRTVGIAAVAAVAVAVVLLVTSLLGGRGYEETVEDFLDAAFSGDAHGILDTLPIKVLEDYADKNGMDVEAFYSEVDRLSQDLADELGAMPSYFGDQLSMDYEILGAESVSGEDLAQIQESYDAFDAEVREAKIVRIRLSFSAGEMEETWDGEVPVIRIGNDWYIDADQL